MELSKDVLEDLTYLQKQMRLTIKYHQQLSEILSSKVKGGVNYSAVSQKRTNQIRNLMEFLEGEMEEITQEQNSIKNDIKMSLRPFQKSWRNESEETILRHEKDVMNEMISKTIYNHLLKNYYSIQPVNVQVRITENEIRQKIKNINIENKIQVPKNNSKQSKSDGDDKKYVALIKSIKKDQTNFMLLPKATDRKSKKLQNDVLKVFFKDEREHDEKDKKRCRAELGEGGIDIKYVRSDEDYSERSSSYDGMEFEDPLKMPSRKRKSPIAVSEESSDGDYMKYYPQLPIESPPKTEYSQEEFLSIFRLITPAVAESLKLRRSERKRRKCAKNEKNDYHYGNFDLNEVAYRIRLNNRKSIFYKPLKN